MEWRVLWSVLLCLVVTLAPNLPLVEAALAASDSSPASKVAARPATSGLTAPLPGQPDPQSLTDSCLVPADSAAPGARPPSVAQHRDAAAIPRQTGEMLSGANANPGQITALGRLPLAFVENQGQVDEQVRFYVQTGNQTLWFTTEGIVFDLGRAGGQASQSEAALPAAAPGAELSAPAEGRPERERLILRQEFLGTEAAPAIEARNATAGTYNYFRGEPSRWRTAVRSYGEVVYRDVWPGVDVRFYGKGRALEQEFVVRAGAAAEQIQVAYRGAEGLRLAEDGSLIVATPFGDLRESKPRIYQEIDGEQVAVEGRFALLDDASYTFAIGSYHPAYDLVVDPTLVYATYLGGSGEERGRGIAVDAAGNAYVTGLIASPSFTTTAGALQARFAGGSSDAFVAKLDASGSALVYFTYLGGSGEDFGRGIAVDAAGNAYVIGLAASTDFPLANPLQPTYGGHPYGDAFVAKLNPAGSALVYSTFFGGDGWDEGYAIAVDAAGSAYVTGMTFSTNLTTVNPLLSLTGRLGALPDAFVAKLNPAGSALVYATYLGGETQDEGRGIAVDSAGNAYVTGWTQSERFPLANAFQPTLRGWPLADAFVAKLNPSGSALVYSSYLGGGDWEHGYDIAVDAAGNAYVTGDTQSTDFPTVNALQPGNGGYYDAFVAKVNPSGSALVYSTYLGGNGYDIGYGIALDANSSVYVAGSTASNNFPTANPLQSTHMSVGDDIFVARLSPTGSGLIFSTYLGGATDDLGADLALDAAGNVYLTGRTAGTDFPATSAWQSAYGGGVGDAFIAKISMGGSAAAGILGIVPSRGGDSGPVSVVIHGSQPFAQGTAVKLTRTGQPDVVGSPVNVRQDGVTLLTTFDLSGTVRGGWDVAITAPDGKTAVLPGAFTVEAGRPADVWVDIGGRERIRVGVNQTLTILYGNRSNVNAQAVPLWIKGIPKDATWSLGFPLRTPGPPEGRPGIDWSQVPVHVVEDDGSISLPLLIGVIPPGATGVLPIHVNVPGQRTFAVEATAFQPLIQSPVSAGTVNCLAGIASVALSVAGIFLPPGAGCLIGVGTYIASAIAGATQIASSDLDSTSGVVWPIVGMTLDATAFVTSCIGGEITGRVGKLVSAIDAGLGVATGCLGPALWKALKYLAVLASLDPNDKVGAAGVGEARYISDLDPLRYTIYFENVISATAPAQTVVISDQLDVKNMDLSTLSLGALAFGSRQVTPPSGLRQFSAAVDLRPAQSLVVSITASLNITTGVATWRFVAIDPATGSLPEDPGIGFLPPNKNAPEGEGSVFFTVMPSRGITSGTQIKNRARIFFDTNAPIDTPEWLNTIDNGKPTSQVAALPDESFDEFSVTWSGGDAGSGVLDYTIYVAENGGPYVPWLRNTTATSGTFSGKLGSAYAFYSVARDRTGNREDTPAAADTSTRATRTRLFIPEVLKEW